MGAPAGWNEGVVTKAPPGWDDAESLAKAKGEITKMAEGAPTYQELVGRPALAGGGAVAGGLLGGFAGAHTGPAAPVMIPLARAEGAALGEQAGQAAGDLLWGKQERPPWYEQAATTGGVSLAADAVMGGASRAGTYLSRKYPEVGARLNRFRSHGVEPLPSEISQSKALSLVEGSAYRFLPTSAFMDKRLAVRERELRAELQRILPRPSGADVTESVETATKGLAALNRQTFSSASKEYEKLWSIMKPDTPVLTPSLQAAAKRFKGEWDDVISGLREEPAFSLSSQVGQSTAPKGGYAIGELTPNPEWVIPQTTKNFTFNDLKLMREKLGEKLAGSSEMIAKGVQGTRGYGGQDTRAYMALRRAIDADIKALSPEAAAQLGAANTAYATAKNTYEKKSVKDVLLAISKEQPELIVDRYFRAGRSTAIDNIKRSMPKSSFDELVAAKVNKESVVEGVVDPNKTMRWLSTLDDRTLKSMFTKPGQASAIDDLQKMYVDIKSAASKGANPSGTAQGLASIGFLSALSTMIMTGNLKGAAGILGGAAGSAAGTWLYLRPFVNDMVAKGIMQPSTARYLATIATGTRSAYQEHTRLPSPNLLQQ